MQVAGRAGRAGLPGEVIVQTDFPTHPVYAALAPHDYDAFAHALLDERRMARAAAGDARGAAHGRSASPRRRRCVARRGARGGEGARAPRATTT